jgi:hypothetical protein
MAAKRPRNRRHLSGVATAALRLERAQRAALKKYRQREGAQRTTHVAKSDPEKNVIGVGVGRKIRGGRALEYKAIHIYVVHKLPKHAVPKKHRIPRQIAGVDTDVIETGRFRAASAPTRPAQSGCSIGASLPTQSTFGTFGAVVHLTDNATDRYILSCNHVLSNWGQFPGGTPIRQPANIDGGSANETIATLFAVHPLRRDRPNEVDAGIAGPVGVNAVNPQVLPPVGPIGPNPIAAAEGMAVEKVGRTTGHTRGKVLSVSAHLDVDTGDPDLGIYTFQNQILVEGDSGPFAALGDSGALVVDTTSRQPTGLLCATSDTTSMTILCHIETVLSLLNLNLVT